MITKVRPGITMSDIDNMPYWLTKGLLESIKDTEEKANEANNESSNQFGNMEKMQSDMMSKAKMSIPKMSIPKF